MVVWPFLDRFRSLQLVPYFNKYPKTDSLCRFSISISMILGVTIIKLP